MESWSTHKVDNQPPARENFNRYSSDKNLVKTFKIYGGSFPESDLRSFGEFLGRQEIIHDGQLANINPPVLKTHDRFGNRIDTVEYHPSYHRLFNETVKYGLHSSPWSTPQKGAHVTRAAMLYLAYQVESGHICPTTMTYGCVPALKNSPRASREWLPKIFSREYDPAMKPMQEKKGVLIGMSMTEKQGGSDVRSNTTQAKPISGTEDEYLLTGHKWFCSAPMSDAFLVLAQTANGLSCFFLPRWLPDGTKNNFFIQRLKDKLGDRSNASSEIELKDTWAFLIGEEGRGVPTIIEMANYTRLDCATAASSLMGWGTAEAIHHCRHRKTFGSLLIDQRVMRRVLVDLAIESEASLLLAMRLASSYDDQDNEYEARFRRIATAIAKYWNTKRSVTHIYESMEVLAGNGFVEDSHFPRMYRQSPVNSIWEGSGNIMCLDVLRALQKDPKTVQVLILELSKFIGRNPLYDSLVEQIKKKLGHPEELLVHARWLVEKLALCLQAGLLLEHADSETASVFCRHRLDSGGPNTFGALEGNIDELRILGGF